MNKKIIVIGIITILLVYSSPAYAITVNTNKKKDSLEKNVSSDTEKLDEFDHVLKNFKNAVIETNNSENQTGLNAGWFNIETKGKGLSAFYEIPVLSIHHHLPTPQYVDFNPFSVSYYICYIVYNDKNASTNITNTVTGDTIRLNGSHSLITGFFSSQSLYFFGNFVSRGVIDGFFHTWLDNIGFPHPLGNLIKNILNKIPGFPIINMTGLNSFLQPFFFGPYNWNTEPTFKTPFISEIREKLFDNLSEFPLPSNIAWLATALGINTLLAFPWFILPSWIPRVQLLNFVEPLNKTGNMSGYSLFVRYNENPNPKSLKRVESIQNGIQKGMLRIDQAVEFLLS
ncbi:MAG: hypothetical protein V5A68_00995 [Candidatus Thermoplasmatota archaeon]